MHEPCDEVGFATLVGHNLLIDASAALCCPLFLCCVVLCMCACVVLLLSPQQLAASGAIPHMFSLCFGFPSGGALLLGE